MKKTKHSEEKIIAAVKQMEAGRPVKEITRTGRDRSDAVQLEVEVRRDGDEATPTWPA